MIEQWMGLHNPDRHEGATTDSAWCLFCSGACLVGDYCHCCLAAEVQAQTARADTAEAAVQRVREALDECSFWADMGTTPTLAVSVEDLDQALDGAR